MRLTVGWRSVYSWCCFCFVSGAMGEEVVGLFIHWRWKCSGEGIVGGACLVHVAGEGLALGEAIPWDGAVAGYGLHGGDVCANRSYMHLCVVSTCALRESEAPWIQFTWRSSTCANLCTFAWLLLAPCLSQYDSWARSPCFGFRREGAGRCSPLSASIRSACATAQYIRPLFFVGSLTGFFVPESIA
ncbi:hypothetical protein BDQ17DRAFT_419788 [Cyathus striatus]|nr:hypothetical protein BDQ17DRAFT_419788 [Cyathus striatus]